MVHDLRFRMTLLFFAGAVVGIGAYAFLFASTPPPYVHNGVVNFRQGVAYWREYLGTAEPAQAYKEAVSQASSLTITESHNVLHSLGQAYYDTLGNEGLVYCRDDYGWGCAHHFLARAIEMQGVGVIGSLMEQCKTQGDEEGVTACSHGIGHGLLSNAGYSLEMLTKLLPLCASLDKGARVSGCQDGLFMEYNMKRLEAFREGDQIKITPLTATNTYGPCKDVPSQYRTTCVYELPNWWSTQNGDLRINKKMELSGERCIGLDGDADGLTGACFEGIGYVAAMNANLDYKTTVYYCASASQEPSYLLRCLSSAAYRMRVVNADGFEKACAGLLLEGVARSYCEEYQMSHPPELRGVNPVPKEA